jgi:signal transduction histidine kinase
MVALDDQKPGAPRTMSAEGVEFARWLFDMERRAIVPLKWVLLLGSIFLWEYARPGLAWLEVDVFIVFFVYGLSILAMHYFILFSKIPPHQVRTFCYGSYGVDLLYVTALIYLGHVHMRELGLGAPDFLVLYFLFLIRGFVLYRSPVESVVVNVLISILFIFAAWLEERSVTFGFGRPFLVKVTLVWMVILLAWFIFEMINRQKFELLRTRERLYQSERLTALGELAAGVAHEINNPIGIISAYADYLIRQAESADPRREDYEVIHSEAQRCKKIVGELLRFARPSETRREPTDLCALNDEVMRFIFHDRTDTTVRLEKSYAANLPWALVDPNQIKQALLNVYVNAQQALGVEGGEIRIAIAPAGREAIQITIGDTGHGIAPKDLARVFDPFFTRKPGGSGLGLTITRRLLEANSGEIEVQANRPRGVMVTITFRQLVSPPAGPGAAG